VHSPQPLHVSLSIITLAKTYLLFIGFLSMQKIITYIKVYSQRRELIFHSYATKLNF